MTGFSLSSHGTVRAIVPPSWAAAHPSKTLLIRSTTLRAFVKSDRLREIATVSPFRAAYSISCSTMAPFAILPTVGWFFWTDPP